LRRLVNLESIQFEGVPLKNAETIDTLMRAIENMPNLTHVSFRAFSADWQGVESVTNRRFLENVVDLKLDEILINRDMLLSLKKFSNLRRLKIVTEDLEPQVVFDALQSVESLVSVHKDKYYRYESYAVEVGVRTEVKR